MGILGGRHDPEPFSISRDRAETPDSECLAGAPQRLVRNAGSVAWLKARDIVATGAHNAGVESAVFRTRSPVSPRQHQNLEELAWDRVHEFLLPWGPT